MEQLDAIITGVSKVSTLVEEITISSKEQAEGISQINVGIQQIDNVVQMQTATSEESASAAESLACQADELNMLLSGFKLNSKVIQSNLPRHMN